MVFKDEETRIKYHQLNSEVQLEMMQTESELLRLGFELRVDEVTSAEEFTLSFVKKFEPAPVVESN